MLGFFARLFGRGAKRPARPAEEDPRVALRRGLAGLEQELFRAEESLRVVAALRRDLHLRRAQADEVATRNATQAERALALGREDLARQALTLQSQTEQRRCELDESIAEVTRQQADLEAARDSLRQQVEQLRVHQTDLGARLAAAEAQLRLREAMDATSVDGASIALALERLEERLDATRARAEALEELGGGGAGSSGPRDDLERRLSRLERAQRVERKLERIKREALAERNASGVEEPKGGNQE